MTFDDITGDARLWAVRYDGEKENELFRLFEQWTDVQQLRIFLKPISMTLVLTLK